MMQAIPIEQIRPDPVNVRVWGASKAADEQLLASVRAMGVIVPIVVTSLREDGFEGFQVIAGHRRLNAAKAAGLKVINCDVRDGLQQGEIPMLQLAENAVRADMTPADVWRAFARLTGEGWAAEAVGLALNLSARRVQQLVLMGGMPRAVTDYISETGDMPRDSELRVLAQADAKRLEAAFKRLPRQGNGIAWWQLVDAVRVARISLAEAAPLFELDEAAKKRIGHVTDLFDPPDHPGYSEKTGAFAKMQAEAMTARLAEFEKAGWTTILRTGEGTIGIPKGCTWETAEIGRTRSMKKAERPDWAVVGTVREDGRTELRLHRKAPKPRETPAVSAPEGAAPRSGGERIAPDPAQHGGDPLAPWLTETGIFAVEAAKRQAVAAALAPETYAYDLLAVALLALADAHGPSNMPEAGRLCGPDGALDVNSDDRRETIHDVALAILGRVIRTAPASRFAKTYLAFPLVQRIGAGFAAEPRMRWTREEMDRLKKPALEKIRASLGLGAFSTQKALKDAIVKQHGKDGAVTLTAKDLPLLACDPAASLPNLWRAAMARRPDEADEDLAEPDRYEPDCDEDDGDALASAGLGTDEDYGGVADEAA